MVTQQIDVDKRRFVSKTFSDSSTIPQSTVGNAGLDDNQLTEADRAALYAQKHFKNVHIDLSKLSEQGRKALFAQLTRIQEEAV